MKELIIITYLSLTLLMGGTGLISDQQEVVQVEQPALNGFTLMTNKGPLDISEKGALFIYPDVGSRDVLRAVKDLPEEKRPYIIIHSGTAEQTEKEFKELGLSEEYYFCKGKSPADTVPSLYFVDKGELKKSLCSSCNREINRTKISDFII
jgi:hypothetical protein